MSVARPIKRIFKYPTGAIIPEGAQYLSTVTQTKIVDENGFELASCWLVWHYFLVEVHDDKQHA